MVGGDPHHEMPSNQLLLPKALKRTNHGSNSCPEAVTAHTKSFSNFHIVTDADSESDRIKT